MIPIPDFMLPYRRPTKSEIALAKKQQMADKIMSRLKDFQPKKGKKKK